MSQVAQTELAQLVRSRRLDAASAWLFVGFLTAVAVGSVVTGGNLVWGGFATVVTTVIVTPAVTFREPRAVLPWEIVILVSLPFVVRVLVRGQTISGVTFIGRVPTYLTVTAIAFIVAVELDVFTPVRMNHSFAALFVVIAMMAVAGVWVIVQWLPNLYPGTRPLLNGRPKYVVEVGLMRDLVAVTIAGLLAGLLFEYYFRRWAGPCERLPEEVAEMAEESETVKVAGLSDAAETDGNPRAPEGGESSWGFARTSVLTSDGNPNSRERHRSFSLVSSLPASTAGTSASSPTRSSVSA